jgi:hypothetical protein
MTALVGALGSPARAEIDGRGALRPARADWELDWWIGADDRWHRASVETAVRQSRPGAAPMYETAMRVPSGDAVERVWGVGTGGGQIVVEFENRSPAPFAVACVLHPAAGSRIRHIELIDNTVWIDRVPALTVPGVVRRWAAARDDGELFRILEENEASSETFTRHDDRGGDLRVALLFPVAHTARLRVAIPFGAEVVAPGELADIEAVSRGWEAQLDRGLRAVLPDEGLQRALDAARADALLADATTGAHVRALEDWGFDTEAESAFRLLSGRQRRAEARAPVVTDDPWPAIEQALAANDPVGLLTAVRTLLVTESVTDGSLVLLPSIPAEWRGQPIEVHDAPTRAGNVSYAVRWHGEYPALIWDSEKPRKISAPGLDGGWTTTEQAGEELLGTPR